MPYQEVIHRTEFNDFFSRQKIRQIASGQNYVRCGGDRDISLTNFSTLGLFFWQFLDTDQSCRKWKVRFFFRNDFTRT